MVFLSTSTKEVILNLYPPTDEQGFLPVLAKTEKIKAEKWKNIEGMLQRIEQRQYQHKTCKSGKKTYSKKAEPVVFPPPSPYPAMYAQLVVLSVLQPGSQHHCVASLPILSLRPDAGPRAHGALPPHCNLVFVKNDCSSLFPSMAAKNSLRTPFF